MSPRHACLGPSFALRAIPAPSGDMTSLNGTGTEAVFHGWKGDTVALGRTAASAGLSFGTYPGCRGHSCDDVPAMGHDDQGALLPGARWKL